MRKQGIPPPRPSKGFWEDNRWLNEHWAEMVRAYPDMWVAVVDQHVVATGRDPEGVAKTAQGKTGRREFPLCFVERGIYVY